MTVRAAWRYRLLFVLLLAVLLRLIIFLGFPSVFDFVATGAIHGSDSYDAYAQNLLATGIYGRTLGQADALIPPLYSYLLAGLYGLFGRGALQVALLHIVLDCFSIAFVYDIARRLLPRGDIVGTLAGLMYAFYPYLIFQNLTVIDTPFFMTELYAFTWLMVLLRSRPTFDGRGWLLAIAGGLVLGLGMLTRPILPPFALLVGIWFLLRLNLWQTLARLLPVALIGMLTLVPWIARNYDVYGAFVPMTITSGSNLWQGNSRYVIPYFRAGYDVQWTSPDPEEIDNLDPQSREADAKRFELALDFWRENPDKLVELFGLKFLVHWSIGIAPRLNPTEGELPRIDYQGNIVVEQGEDGELLLTDLPPGDPVGAYSLPLFDQVGRAVHVIYWGSLFVLGCVGIVLTWRQWRDVSLLWFLQIAMTLVYVVFHPSTRYRVPTDPAWFIFSAAALVSLYFWYTNRRTSAAPHPSTHDR
ncbi:MAG: glycosyltransferase family 39 protein [Anaerolineae bacterium]|nr:glycosyltransferase family 39 protein [Anaerolineae bacterium]